MALNHRPKQHKPPHDGERHHQDGATWPNSSTEPCHVRVYRESLRYALGRKLGLTAQRRVSCLVPRDARVGDSIVIVPGCHIPFILRKKTDDKGEYFRIVGCAYVHGIMDGEAVPLDKDGDLLSKIEIR